jgi:hypothetical protein
MGTTPLSLFNTPVDNSTGEVAVFSTSVSKFDNQFNGTVSVAITGSTVLATSAFLESGWIRLTGTPGSTFSLSISTNPQSFTIRNETDGVVTLKRSTGSAELSTGRTGGFYSDGTDIFARWGAINLGSPYHLAIWAIGVTTASEKILFHTPVQDFTMPVNLTNSVMEAEVAATALTTFIIQKNGASVGTFQFAIAATSATFTFAAETVWSADDKDSFEIIGPVSPDATLADIHGTFAGVVS